MLRLCHSFFLASGPHRVGRSQRERGRFRKGVWMLRSKGTSGIHMPGDEMRMNIYWRTCEIGKCILNLWNEAIRMIWRSFSRRPFFMVWQKVLRRSDWRGHGTVKTELRIPMVSLKVGFTF